MKTLLTLLFAALLLSGCASTIDPDNYSVGAIGVVNRAVAGTVVAVREGHIKGTGAAGGTIGAGLGAGGGYAAAFTANTPLRIAATVGGAIVGGVVGDAVESAASKQTVEEYVVETRNGNFLTVVQEANPTFAVGDKVFVLDSSPARIVADARSVVPAKVTASGA